MTTTFQLKQLNSSINNFQIKQNYVLNLMEEIFAKIFSVNCAITSLHQKVKKKRGYLRQRFCSVRENFVPKV